MNKPKLKHALLALVLCTSVLSLHAQDDGIPVSSMSRMRGLGGDARQFDQQSKLQYDQMLNEAHKKDAVATDRNPQLIRLRAISKRLIPYTARWNPESAKWDWQVNLLRSDTVNAFCMPGGRIAFYNGILTKLNLTDDEVAMVMGHEIAHALREHARERMGKSAATNIGVNVLSQVLGFGQVGQTLTQYGAQLLTLEFSRED